MSFRHRNPQELLHLQRRQLLAPGAGSECEGGEPRCGTVVKAFEGEPKAGERDHFVAEN